MAQKRLKRIGTRRVWLVIATAASVLIAAMVLLLKVKIPAIIEERLQTALHDACPTCALHIDSIDVSLFALLSERVGVIRLRRIQLSNPNEQKVPMFELDIGSLEIRVDIESLGGGDDFRIQFISVRTPTLVFRDRDSNPPAKKTASANDSARWQIDGAEITDGQFQYVRETRGTLAEFNVTGISATVGPATSESKTTMPDDAHRHLEIEAHAGIEKSGRVGLKLAYDPSAKELWLDADLQIQDLDLSKLNKFLKPNAGVELHGHLNLGRGLIRVRGQHETARVWADYRGLNVKTNPIYDRSGPMAFLLNLGIDMTMADDNKDSLDEDRVRTATYTRQDGQSIGAFMLQGLKAAAIKVAQAN